MQNEQNNYQLKPRGFNIQQTNETGSQKKI